jgi:DNA topoisomerase I
MDLIILESPNKVADVEKYARKCGLDARATATVGHLVDLPPMRDGAAVRLETFTAGQLVPRDKQAANRIARLKADIAKADRVIVATDPDREGEAIAAQVWPWIPKGRAWRAHFHEITAAGVARGLSEMKGVLNGHAVDAAVTRRMIDRLAGWHASALVFEKLPGHRGVSAGRLQSAALRLVVERAREHKAFESVVTFGVTLRLRTSSGEEFSAELSAGGRACRFKTRAEAESIRAPGHVTVRKVMVSQSSERPRPPFEATSWLQVAQKALGLSVKDATAATQGLFETGSTTYPRTDCVRVSDDAITWARAELLRRFGPRYVPAVPWIHKDKNAGVQGAHEAIRPTLDDDHESLKRRRTGKWGAAYGLVESRFLASQASAREVERTQVALDGGELEFIARGEVELFDGWREVLGDDVKEEAASAPPTDDVEDARTLPRLADGMSLVVLGADITSHVSKPKPLFTQASLIAELKRRGIGRPSTYQSVVPILLSRFWAEERIGSDGSENSRSKERRRKLPVLVPTSVGTSLADFLAIAVPSLVNYEFTATLEGDLDQIEAGTRTRVQVGHRWWEAFQAEIEGAKVLPSRKVERPLLGECPKCLQEGRAGKLRLIKGVSRTSGKAYEFAACDADELDVKVCGYTAAAEKGRLQRQAACPECGAAMKPIRRRDGGHSLVCVRDGWFLADKRWVVVKAPRCPRCAGAMTHRERSGAQGSFFWACFADGAFVDADAFGKVHGAIVVKGPKTTT